MARMFTTLSHLWERVRVSAGEGAIFFGSERSQLAKPASSRIRCTILIRAVPSP